MIEWLRDYIFYYAQKSDSLNQRKTILLREELSQSNVKKNFNLKTLLENLSQEKMNSYDQLQEDFSQFSWLTHYNPSKTLFANIDASKKEIEVMMYHLKKDNATPPLKSSGKKEVDLILFLSKMLTGAESRYWPTELEMTVLVWTVRRIAHVIRLSKHSTIIYTNHEANSVIAAKTKLNTSNIDKLNLKLIRVSMYLFQFWLDVKHRSEKSKVISNVLNKLSTVKKKVKNTLKIDRKDSETDQVYAYAMSLVEMLSEFRKTFIDGYVKDSAWKKIRPMLKELRKRANKKNSSTKTGIDFVIKENLIYHVKDNLRLCISESCEKTIFELAHDQNNHADHHRTYHRLVESVFMSRMSKKVRQYINHCSSCELNQTKRHAIYEKLVFITLSTISFRIIAMNFIVTLSKQFDSILTITDKAFKRVSVIFDKITWSASIWANALLDRFLVSN